jgi:3'-phosphoadenosine 5'-phosphosulfate sulfotransferase (PAPS reductase)/FAD synthetase
MFMSFKEIHVAQKMPLDYKIQTAVEAIKAGFKVCASRASLAFSGGKDSTVLWHIIRENFPCEAANMAVIFGNTGVEFPESLKFAQELGKEWAGVNFYEAKPDCLTKDGLKYVAQVETLEWLIGTGKVHKVLKADGKLKSTDALERAATPTMWAEFERKGLVWKKGAPKNYWWCVDQYGWPILGKAASKLKARRINIDCFLLFSETTTEKPELKQYYDVLRKSKFSMACCDILKKEPSERLQARLNIDVVFKGLMAAESRSRKINFCTRGYLFKSSRNHASDFYHCNPLSLWTDEDIWEYIHRFNVPYSPLYDMEYKDTAGHLCNIKRNGCMGCYTDYGRKDSHMFVMRQTHQKVWRFIMKKGMAAEIQKLRQSAQYRPNKKNYSRLGILDGISNDEQLAWAIDNRQCAFD